MSRVAGFFAGFFAGNGFNGFNGFSAAGEPGFLVGIDTLSNVSMSEAILPLGVVGSSELLPDLAAGKVEDTTGVAESVEAPGSSKRVPDVAAGKVGDIV